MSDTASMGALRPPAQMMILCVSHKISPCTMKASALQPFRPPPQHGFRFCELGFIFRHEMAFGRHARRSLSPTSRHGRSKHTPPQSPRRIITMMGQMMSAASMIITRAFHREILSSPVFFSPSALNAFFFAIRRFRPLRALAESIDTSADGHARFAASRPRYISGCYKLITGRRF